MTTKAQIHAAATADRATANGSAAAPDRELTADELEARRTELLSKRVALVERLAHEQSADRAESADAVIEGRAAPRSRAAVIAELESELTQIDSVVPVIDARRDAKRAVELESDLPRLDAEAVALYSALQANSARAEDLARERARCVDTYDRLHAEWLAAGNRLSGTLVICNRLDPEGVARRAEAARIRSNAAAEAARKAEVQR